MEDSTKKTIYKTVASVLAGAVLTWGTWVTVNIYGSQSKQAEYDTYIQAAFSTLAKAEEMASKADRESYANSKVNEMLVQIMSGHGIDPEKVKNALESVDPTEDGAEEDRSLPNRNTSSDRSSPPRTITGEELDRYMQRQVQQVAPAGK